MEIDRFKKYDDDVKQAVLSFERMRREGSMRYIDLDDLEMVIDFYLETGNAEQVESALSYGEHLFPLSDDIKLRRAHFFCALGDTDKALTILKELNKSNPGNTDVMYALGIVYSQLDQPQKAIQYFQKASSDNYELGLVYGNIADEYYKLSDYNMALKYYKKAIAESPSEERSIYNLLCIYEDLNNIEDAVTYFQDHVQDNPYNIHFWICLGSAYDALELHEKAIDAFEYALAIDKTHFNTYLLLAEAYSKNGDAAKACSVLLESLDYTDDRSTVYYSMGKIYCENNNYAAAIIYLRKAVDEDPSFGDAWCALGGCYANTNDLYTAIQMVERAIAINPQSSTYMQHAAILYASIGNDEAADKLFQCTLHLDDEQDENWLAYAEFLMTRERYDEAIDLLNKGIVNAEHPSSFNIRLAACYYITGRRNFLFNAIRACMEDSECNINDLLSTFPEISNDPDVVSIINSK